MVWRWFTFLILLWPLAVSARLPRNGLRITNIYDAGGNLAQVKQVGGSGTVFWAAQGFNAVGQLTGITFGNGVATTFGYYANSKRLQQTLTTKGTANLQNLSYTYDRVSNLKSISDGVYSNTASAALSSLVYDDLHRLTSLTRPAVSQSTTFSYDAIGNLTSSGENGGGAYDYGTRLPHAVKSANGRSYAYDANGNMLVRGTQRLSYDPENRLEYVVTTNSVYSMFGYDAGGARLWKQTSGTNGLQVWIGGNYEEKNGQVLFHISANGQTVCTFDKIGTNVFVYYHPDHLHSTAIETDVNGARSQHYEYMAFGQERFTESSTAFPVSRRYTSQVLDEDTGLYFYGARYYDPVLGRFIQPDSIIPSLANPQHLNRYSYTLNNPLKYTDPTGYQEAEPARLEIEPRDPLQTRINLEIQYKGYARPSEMLSPNERIRMAEEYLEPGGTRGLSGPTTIGASRAPSRPPTGEEIAEYTRQNPESLQRLTGETSPNVPRRPGRLGNSKTQEHIADVASQLENKGWKITGGGGQKPEEYIPGPGRARKGSSYPDITAERNGRTLRANTVDTRANGSTPTTREANNAARIRAQKPDDKLILIPKPKE